MNPSRATVEAWAASRYRGLTMAPLGCDVDELLEAYLALLDERDRLAVNAARWRALMDFYGERVPDDPEINHTLGWGDDAEVTAAIDAWIARKEGRPTHERQ
jgi:hypothetical protein